MSRSPDGYSWVTYNLPSSSSSSSSSCQQRALKGSYTYVFFLQIMPQLLYYFGVKNDPDSLDWGTIVIYTCLASCESSISYMEEFAWVQLYPAEAMP